MKAFEARFSTQIVKFNSISTTTKIPECLRALLIWPNSYADDLQRVSKLAAAAPSMHELGDNATRDDFLEAVTYELISSVIRQFNKQPNQQTLKGNYTLTVNIKKKRK